MEKNTHAYNPVFTLLAIRTKSKSARIRLARAGAVRNSSSKILRHLSFHRCHMMYIDRAMPEILRRCTGVKQLELDFVPEIQLEVILLFIMLSNT
jgi:hypothetical protein